MNGKKRRKVNKLRRRILRFAKRAGTKRNLFNTFRRLLFYGGLFLFFFSLSRLVMNTIHSRIPVSSGYANAEWGIKRVETSEAVVLSEKGKTTICVIDTNDVKPVPFNKGTEGENLFEANVSELRKLTYAEYKDLDTTSRSQVLCLLAEIDYYYLTGKEDLHFRVEAFSGERALYTRAYFSQPNTIVLSYDTTTERLTAMKSVFHEVRHAFQYQIITLSKKYDLLSQTSFRHTFLNEWSDNFINYTNGYDDSGNYSQQKAVIYKEQAIEKDAFEYSEERVSELLNVIKEYEKYD